MILLETANTGVELQQYVMLSAILFSIGVYGVLARRNAVLILMSVELMLNAVSINMVAFAVYTAPDLFVGIIFTIFIITIAAAEVGLALGIVLRVFRNRGTANVDEIDSLKW
jgi:NADH:ubiquinone oxidoreductase subunit K